jgi:hypothetical protein
MTEKPGPKINENQYNQENFEDLKKQFPKDEAKRKAKIDFTVICLMFEDAFYNGKFNWYEQWKIAQQLRKFNPDLAVTDEEITYSLKRCSDRKRLVVKNFFNDARGWLTKWVYNIYFMQPPEKSPSASQTQPPYTPPSSGEQNPFESEEYKKLKDELDNL